ncbi:ribosome recycling factor [Armatimonas sp.]|uniref:ribosome recycling factor n=1 Tax=Armatimonas sp. TaxID=1872638 RepID=UPI00286C8071|nr:ribosome recycling factor [Armatimonas sp.]
MSVSTILKDTEVRMGKTLESTAADYATLRTGRANPAMLDGLKIDYYGTPMNVRDLANISSPEPRVLLIEPWDKAAMPLIEKAITNSSLGLNPNSDGVRIRLNIPALTTERRKEFVKQLAGKAEAGRVALRNIRRDANEHLKKDDEVTEDEAKRAEKDVQKFLDKYVAELEAMTKAKESELLDS